MMINDESQEAMNKASIPCKNDSDKEKTPGSPPRQDENDDEEIPAQDDKNTNSPVEKQSKDKLEKVAKEIVVEEAPKKNLPSKTLATKVKEQTRTQDDEAPKENLPSKTPAKKVKDQTRTQDDEASKENLPSKTPAKRVKEQTRTQDDEAPKENLPSKTHVKRINEQTRTQDDKAPKENLPAKAPVKKIKEQMRTQSDEDKDVKQKADKRRTDQGGSKDTRQKADKGENKAIQRTEKTKGETPKPQAVEQHQGDKLAKPHMDDDEKPVPVQPVPMKQNPGEALPAADTSRRPLERKPRPIAVGAPPPVSPPPPPMECQQPQPVYRSETPKKNGFGKWVKSFFRRNNKENTMSPMDKAARQARAKSECAGNNQHLLRDGDDVAPLSGRGKIPMKKLEIQDEDLTATSLKVQDIKLRPGLTLVKGNNDNNGKLFVGKKPFWRSGAAEEEITNETFTLASSVVLDVANKKKRLAVPSEPLPEFDPWAEQATMASRDAKFFAKDLVFSNTVRSIIDTMSPEDPKEAAVKEAHTKIITHKQWPRTMLSYKFNARSHELVQKELPYIRTNKGVVHVRNKSKGKKADG